MKEVLRYRLGRDVCYLILIGEDRYADTWDEPSVVGVNFSSFLMPDADA